MEYKITYEIVKHPKLGDLPKYFIYYYGGDFHGVREFFALDLNKPQNEIKQGYTKHKDSL